MGRLLIFIFAAIVLDIFAIIDIVLIDKSRVRAFPKALWILIVVAVPLVGAILWFIVGRQWGRPSQQQTTAPDDDPAFLRNLRRDEEQDERIRRLEQELAELDDDKPQD
ncbi:MAG: PLD nuclease N-terminal domain-containing protein [Rhodoglobus sp.]